MKRAVILSLSILAGCASSDPAASPQPAERVDPQLAQLQTSMTELLERLDVLNDRIQRVEERGSQIATPQSVAPPTPAALPSDAPRAAEVGGATPRRAAEAGGAPPSRANPPSRSLASARIADSYRRGVGLYASGRSAESRRIFQDVFDADPTGDLADNALFWIGETYFAARDYASAMRYYKRVTTEFGDQNKAPDALFKIALAYEKTGDLALARSSFEEVIRKYPYSTPAASAKQELKRIQY